MPQKCDFFIRRTISAAVLALPLTLCFGTVAFGQEQEDVSRSSIAANNERLTAEHRSAVRASSLPPTDQRRILDEVPDVPSDSSNVGGEPPVLDETVKHPIAMTPAEELAAKNKIVRQKSVASTQSDMISRLLERVNDQEDRIRNLQGSVDVLQKQVSTMQASYDKRLDDLKFQVSHSSPNVVPAAVPARPAVKTIDESFSGLISAARSAKAQKNYSKAETLSRKALDKAPKSGRVDAQYLLAQSLAGEKVWSKAAVAYYDSYKLAPKSSVAPHALLGTAQSMHALGDHQAACEALSKVNKEFPHPAPSFKAEVSRVQTQYHCG
ncbi:tetratricopeptide repeat protein [Acetobacteraceae bacterium]|nr:tetratricopeptide repeat protein [Acetobacteraceae bacterium]